jgi:DNA polymerase
VPEGASLAQLRLAAAGCTACPLYENATQTVFGEGRSTARIVLIGEQPGDREDREGHPFVGPAGKLLDQALEAAGLDRAEAYVTNVVKHFKFERHGKARLHKRPNAMEVKACRPWLDAELARLRPQAVVLLGATAAQALLGRGFRVTEERGRVRTDLPLAPKVMATVHPSSVLRAPSDEERRAAREAFIADLTTLARALKS